MEIVHPFKRLQVESHFNALTRQRVQVAWVMNPAFDEEGPWKFTLERGRSATEDSWEPVAETTDQPWLFDNSPVLGEFERSTYYRIILLDGNGRRHVSEPTSFLQTWGHYDWRLMREVMRKESMLQRKKSGCRGVMLKLRTWGDACECVDPETKQVKNANCLECFGTGYVGGYYPPLEYWVTMDPAQRLKRLQGDGGLVTAVIETARGLAWPAPEGNDIWVQLDTNKRYRISDDVRAIARHRGIDLVLDLRFEELPQSNIVYRIPTP